MNYFYCSLVFYESFSVTILLFWKGIYVKPGDKNPILL